LSKLDTWTENRPEGMVILSDTSGASSTPANPCGWLLARDLDKERLPGVKVGTVDKFQGQQATVVFFSMAASSFSNIAARFGRLVRLSCSACQGRSAESRTTRIALAASPS